MGRELWLASPRGYCAGVGRATQVVALALQRYGQPVYVRKQIVHNKHVVARLAAQGAVFVDELDAVPTGATVVFSAHGVSPAVRDEAASRGLNVIDATCPLVTKVHREAVRLTCPVVLIGHAGHEEVEGTMGEAPDRMYLVETPEDVAALPLPLDQPVAWLSQTTLSVDETHATVAALRARFPRLIDPPSDDICYATQNRQQAVRELAGRCQLVIVVGSANSSNSMRLVEVARTSGAATHRVDSAEDLDDAWFDDVEKVGVTSGASVPEDLVVGVIDWLTAHGWPDAQELRTTEETLHFALPPALR
ncbi:MAG: 4-hydroxy-3-methylbut-2-enyl diphosphate reductase [Propionibacteriaceae bacterium]|nr:4-hydroxy-3-methylbut-2-enyl diphosphate reductase [Propionibacteriaceae bacterium]